MWWYLNFPVSVCIEVKLSAKVILTRTNSGVWGMHIMGLQVGGRIITQIMVHRRNWWHHDLSGLGALILIQISSLWRVFCFKIIFYLHADCHTCGLVAFSIIFYRLFRSLVSDFLTDKLCALMLLSIVLYIYDQLFVSFDYLMCQFSHQLCATFRIICKRSWVSVAVFWSAVLDIRSVLCFSIILKGDFFDQLCLIFDQ